MRRALPWIAFISGLLLGGYGAALAAASDLLPLTLSEAPAPGAAMIVLGVLLLVASVGSLAPEKAPSAPAPVATPQPAPPPPRPRADFAWSGSTAPQVPTTETQLEDVRRRIAQLKVRYGLGEVGPEAYRKLMSDLEAEETSLERVRQRGGT